MCTDMQQFEDVKTKMEEERQRTGDVQSVRIVSSL